jgi:hypothetical protein
MINGEELVKMLMWIRKDVETLVQVEMWLFNEAILAKYQLERKKIILKKRCVNFQQR